MKNNRLSRQKSDRIYSGFIRWRENIIDLENTIIVVEGKRDVEVLNSLGITRNIIQYSQISISEFEEKIPPDIKIIPLVDFDEKGEEYLRELKKYKNTDLELRNNLYALTNGRLKEFEDLISFLKKILHPSYWLILQDLLE